MKKLGLERVRAHRLSKLYDRHRALHEVDLEVVGGSITALLGPNGAGKTTFLEILSTLKRPTQGKLEFIQGGGQTLARASDARGCIGLVSHEALTYGELTGFENLVFFSQLYGQSTSAQEAKALLETFQLARAADRPAKTYSRGMRQRLSLARVLICKPSLLLLDEPFTGLDQASVRLVQEQALQLKAEGCIVVMVSHDLGATSTIADRAVILRAGQIVSDLPKVDGETELRMHYARAFSPGSGVKAS